jgi:hypothetical protein
VLIKSFLQTIIVAFYTALEHGVISFMMSVEANEVNDDVFRKASAQDDKGLEEEAKSLLVRNFAVSRFTIAY